jgi:hypothetical protein
MLVSLLCCVHRSSFCQPFQFFFSSFLKVRQLSAIFLRKVIGRHWSKMPAKAQLEFRASLLQMLAQEPVRDVRNGICELIASVAKLSTQWPELFQFVVQATTAAAPLVRETGFRVLYAMTQTVGPMLKSSFKSVQPLIAKGLNDGENAVRVRALRVLNELVTHLDEADVNLLRPLIEPSVKVIGFCVENGFVSDASDTLYLFNELLQGDMDKALDGFLQPLLQFMMGLVRNPKHDLQLRDSALMFVQNVASLRTKQFLNNKWLQPTFEMLLPLLAEPLDEMAVDDDLSAQRLALSCVDVLCAAVPEKYIGPPIVAFALQLQRSNNWLERKGALEILSVASQGCFLYLRDHLNEFLPVLKAGFSDPQIQVRMTACVTLATFCEFLQQPVIEKHAELVPILAGAMRDNEEVAMRGL